MDITSYILSKRYIDGVISGAGAIRGAPCQIQSIEPVEGGNQVTFLWELNDGSTQSETILIKDGVGEDGVGIVGIEQIQSPESDEEYLLKIRLSDGTEYSFVIPVIQGKNGATPEIGQNGHWIIDGVDTGIAAAPIITEF